MTAADQTVRPCPNCQGTFSFDQDDGTKFCPECRTTWDPRSPVAPTIPAPGVPDTPDAPVALTTAAGLAEAWSTILDVTYYDPTPGVERIDRYTHVTGVPHSDDDAIAAASRHFSDFQGVEIRGTHVVLRDPAPDEDPYRPNGPGEKFGTWPELTDPATAAEEADQDLISEAEELIADMGAQAEAYLEALVGTGVTLEGGQEATLLGFPDDDHAEVQLRDGSVATVDFNTILRADRVVTEAEVGLIEVDEDTAALFGSAALLMACMVIEAGIASIAGEGADQHLIEPPSGWVPDDGEVLPLLEQSAAAAVAMLIQEFSLPRHELANAIARVREGINPILNPEEQSDGTDED